MTKLYLYSEINNAEKSRTGMDTKYKVVWDTEDLQKEKIIDGEDNLLYLIMTIKRNNHRLIKVINVSKI
tara:strand:- start:1363 stop:1569 length:207 start_codon:yes stop_codon:yes gene_type:complete